MADDKPFSVDEQIDNMKKYVFFTKRARMKDFIDLTLNYENLCLNFV